jgi:hypothetical protein
VPNLPKTPFSGGDVLLVDPRRHELDSIEPGDVLHVVAVGPKSVEGIVGTGSDISVVAEEASAEPIARVNWLSCDDGTRAGS